MQTGSAAELHAVSVASFRNIWSTELGPGEVMGMCLTQNRDQNYLIVAQRNHLLSIEPETGSILWSTEYQANSHHPLSRQIPQPVIWGDYVFHMSNNQILVAYTLLTGDPVYTFDLEGRTYSSPIVGRGHLYVGCEDGQLYCFEGD